MMTGNKMIDTIILALALVIGLGSAGIFVYTEMIYKRPIISNKLEQKTMMAEIGQTNFVQGIEIKKQIINLYSKRGRLRFLDLTLSLVPFKRAADNANGRVEERSSQVSDIIIDIASKMSPNELNTISGKILLENRLKVAINKALGQKLIKRILFTRFVIQ